jgi:hypothetical protein
MSLDALLVVHRWCTGTIARLGNATPLDLVIQELAQLVRDIAKVTASLGKQVTD